MAITVRAVHPLNDRPLLNAAPLEVAMLRKFASATQNRVEDLWSARKRFIGLDYERALVEVDRWISLTQQEWKVLALPDVRKFLERIDLEVICLMRNSLPLKGACHYGQVKRYWAMLARERKDIHCWVMNYSREMIREVLKQELYEKRRRSSDFMSMPTIEKIERMYQEMRKVVSNKVNEVKDPIRELSRETNQAIVDYTRVQIGIVGGSIAYEIARHLLKDVKNGGTFDAEVGGFLDACIDSQDPLCHALAKHYTQTERNRSKGSRILAIVPEAYGLLEELKKIGGN